MEKAFKFYQMELIMKDTGGMIWQMEEEEKYSQIKMYMMANF